MGLSKRTDDWPQRFCAQWNDVHHPKKLVDKRNGSPPASLKDDASIGDPLPRAPRLEDMSPVPANDTWHVLSMLVKKKLILQYPPTYPQELQCCKSTTSQRCDAFVKRRTTPNVTLWRFETLARRQGYSARWILLQRYPELLPEMLKGWL